MWTNRTDDLKNITFFKNHVIAIFVGELVICSASTFYKPHFYKR